LQESPYVSESVHFQVVPQILLASMAFATLRCLIFCAVLLTAIQLFVISLVKVKLKDPVLPNLALEGLSLLEVRSTLKLRGVYGQKSHDAGLVTIFSTQCKPYHDWQSVTLFDTWHSAHVPGTLTRIMACSKSQRKLYKREHLVNKSEMSTYVHDDVTLNGWTTLNKPWGIHSWLTNGSGAGLPDETVVLILDPDISFRETRVWETLQPLVERAKSGVPVGINCQFVVDGMRYHKGAVPAEFLRQSDLAHVQSIAPPILIRKDQLNKMASGWHDVTKRIVQDPRLLALVHDGANPAPWIAEMYGYSISAAANVPRHDTQKQWPQFQSETPPYTSSTFGDMPLLLHYAHSFKLCGRPFGKRNYHNIDLLDCNLNPRVLRALRPPPANQIRDASCRVCMGKGDVFGAKPQCMDPVSKIVSYEAWARVYIAVMRWRVVNCPSSGKNLAQSRGT